MPQKGKKESRGAVEGRVREVTRGRETGVTFRGKIAVARTGDAASVARHLPETSAIREARFENGDRNNLSLVSPL